MKSEFLWSLAAGEGSKSFLLMFCEPTVVRDKRRVETLFGVRDWMGLKQVILLTGQTLRMGSGIADDAKVNADSGKATGSPKLTRWVSTLVMLKSDRAQVEEKRRKPVY